MKSSHFSAGLLMMLTTIAVETSPAAPPKPAVEAFDLSDTRLLEGPFKQAMTADQGYLLSLDADRLLTGFLANASLPIKAKAYGGWEARGLAGQTLGHYLSACALMFAATGDTRFQDKVSYVIDELEKCQNAVPDGFLGGMPRGRETFDEITQGNIHIKGGFDLNGGWVPWYNQHKLFAGVRDACLLAHNEKAKQIYIKLGDWCAHVVANLDDKQMQTMLSVEQGGIMESLADLYAVTRDEKYLTLAKKFWHKAVLDPLAAGQDKLSGLHANTNIPKVIGAARLYELTGDPKYAATAKTFWTAVTQNRSFVTGSNSDREHFFDLGLEAKKLGPENGETCNVYNMLKLTGHLARWSGDASPYDFYERAMINHILGSIDPESGMCTYFQSLEPGRFKVYGTPDNSFWCCTGTGLENHSKYAADAYTHTDDTLDVNLFVASELTWKERGLTLRQETGFPLSDQTTLTLKLDKPTQLKLRIRVPGWADSGIDVTGATTAHGDAGSGFLTIDRTWKDGDVVDVKMPMAMKVHRAVDDPTMAAVMYGPIVLAAQLGREDFPPSDIVPSQNSFDSRPVPPVPLLVTDSKTLEWLQPIDGKPFHFSTHGVGRPTEMEFAPLFATHHQRYGVYMRMVDTQQYSSLQKKLADDAEAKRLLDARTVDEIVFGEQQSEKDHDTQSQNSHVGNFAGKPWRDASAGGFFSAKVKVKSGVTQVVRCTYWGSDANRAFDVLIDGQKIATQTLSGRPVGEFFSVDYPIPAALIASKDSVAIEFRPHANSTAGGLYGCRILTAEAGPELLNGK